MSVKRFQILRLGALTLAMFGFGFALVPLYDVICQITGLNGQSDGIRLESSVTEAPDESRLVTVQFLTTVNGGGIWDFSVESRQMSVQPGRLYTVNFHAVNRSERDLVAQAVPSVAPWEAARHVRKTECFCFTQQPFSAGEARAMPMRFMLDPELPADVDTVTLSYTFFDATELAFAGTD